MIGVGALVAVLALSACGGVRGEDVFAQPTVGGRAGCVACHSVTSADVVIGPNLMGIGAVAGDRVPGLDAADYLRTAILDPDAHIAPGYQAGEMPGGWTEVLSDEEIDALVSYLAGLR